MAENKLESIFLSASIPFASRDPKYFETADIIAIRDSVLALASVVLPSRRLVWGGHPSITPIIYYVLESMKVTIQNHVLLYQSLFFKDQFPADTNKFKNVILTEKADNITDSLKIMRTKMFTENSFEAAVFIGGMEGVEDEFKMFRSFHPKADLFPVASTGAAAKIIYESIEPRLNERLAKDFAYMSMFRSLLVTK